MRVLESGLYVKETTTGDQPVKVALRHIRLDVEVLDVASKTIVTQVYKNTEETAIEGVYCFPVEESAAVCGFTVKTGDRVIEGKIEEKEKAFEIYDKAIQSGDGSYLLDQELQDILVISAGNIKPGQEVTVSITYVSQLPVTDGIIRLQIPTTVSPRYAPANEDPVKVDRITPPYESSVDYGLELYVKVLAEKISGITSPSHDICIKEDGRYKIISLKHNITELDRDFILECETKKEEESVCLVSRHENGEDSLLFRFFPTFEKIPGHKEVKSEVIFILDCSGSMQGSSIEEAKAALELSLRSLNEGDLFQIICFGSSWNEYAKEPVLYGEKTLEKALSFIRSISANMGGTELLGPVGHVCHLGVIEGYSRDVILLTDGEVSNPDGVIHEVHKAADTLRVFSFGIGYGASHHLVKGIARASGGAFEMIQPGEKIQPKVLRQFSRMSQPFLTDIRIELNGGELELPSRLPPLFEDDDYTVLAKVNRLPADGGEIVFTGNYLGDLCSWKARIKTIDTDNTIGILWALSRIKHLKEEFSGGSNQMDRKRKSAEKMITDLGLMYSILTEYTSFVAVETRTAGEKTEGQPEYRRIPVQLTKDWHGTGSGMGNSGGLPVNKPMRMTVDACMAPSPKSRAPIFGNLFGGGTSFSHKKTKMKKGTSEMKTSGMMAELAEKSEDQVLEWYLELLGTQEADGHFTGKTIVAAHYSLSDQDIAALSKQITLPGNAPVDPALGEKILITFLAVKALSGDPMAYSMSKRAVKKGEKWLGKNAPGFLIAGREACEYLRDTHNINV